MASRSSGFPGEEFEIMSDKLQFFSVLAPPTGHAVVVPFEPDDSGAAAIIATEKDPSDFEIV